MSFTLTPFQHNPFDIEQRPNEPLLSRLATLNGRPQSSERTLIQALAMICQAVDAPVGVIARFDDQAGQIVTVASYNPDDRQPHIEEKVKNRAIRKLTSPTAARSLQQFDLVANEGQKSLCGWTLPLVWQGELLGLVAVVGESTAWPQGVTPSELEGAAAFIALMVQNQMLAENSPASPPLKSEAEIKEAIRLFSHDLRNPLAAIMSCSELLVKQPALLNSDLLEQLLGTLQKSSRQAVQLLNSFHNKTLY